MSNGAAELIAIEVGGACLRMQLYRKKKKGRRVTLYPTPPQRHRQVHVSNLDRYLFNLCLTKLPTKECP